MKKLAIYQWVTDDIVREILSYLPVQSLFRFKTVCKSWNNIISSSNFAKLHLDNYCNNNNSNNNDDGNCCIFVRTFDRTIKNWKLSSMMLLPGRDKSSEEFTLDANFVTDFDEGNRATYAKLNISSKIVGPVNGLICVYGTSLSERIALCNPCLRESETLPRSSSRDISFKGFFFRCAGLGYDSVKNDVKIVQVINYLAMEEGPEFTRGILVDIYSRNTNTWKKLECDNVHNTWARKPIAASHNNNGSFFHWLAWDQSKDRKARSNILVLSFDMHREVFQSTLLPPCIYDDDPYCSEYKNGRKVKTKVLSMDNSLFLFVCPLWELFLQGDKFMDRWVLHGLGNEGRWTRLSRVGPLLRVSKPVGFWKSHGLVLKYVKEKKLVIYDCSTGKTRNIEIRETVLKTVLCYPKVVGYRGSLISLGM